MTTIGPWDYVIIALVLLISTAMGIYYRITGGKQTTTKEFLLADRSMSITPVAFSLMTSFTSAVALLGGTTEIYQYGTMYVLIIFAGFLTKPIFIYLFIPVFYELKSASAYEYLEMRFGYTTRLYASLAFLVQIVLYMGVVLYAPALALDAVTGINRQFSIIIIGVVCTFYSTVGGMKAVLVTDIFQTLLMFVSIFSIIVRSNMEAGGFGEIWSAAVDGGRIYFEDISIDPTRRHTWWTMLIGGSVINLATSVNQIQVQRILSVRNLKSAQVAMWWGLPMSILFSLSMCAAGLGIYYHYKDCDPVLEGRIASRDQLMPLFVVDTMGSVPGLAGLFIAGIFSASLSTVSSSISSVAAVTIEDYMKPLHRYVTKREAAESKTAWYSKLFSIVYGAIFIGIAFLAGSLGSLLQASLSVSSIVGGPLLGLFLLGMCFKSANQKGAITAMTIAFAFCFWLAYGQPKPPIPILEFSTAGCPAPTAKSHILQVFTTAVTQLARQSDEHYFYLYRISYMWYSLLGCLTSLLGGLLFSWLYACFGWDDNARIYTDTARDAIKYELFMPPVAQRLRRQQMSAMVVTSTSSDCVNKSNEEKKNIATVF